MRHEIRDERDGEAGFTLIETLVAIVVLVFGLIAVTNLLLVGATNNSVANHGTAATSVATQRMELLKAEPFRDLTAGGDLNSDVTDFSENVNVEGVGVINVRWQITAPEPQLRFIAVQAEGTGPMVRTRSRINLTTFRSCTADTAGCPEP
ncbi:MAG TPA: prepilin-type N-terminal cleavage/methylation domain-containing protein [Vicinamibacteria bacterium]|nr:prepilin-type N-terminal cleavage/methylation domain-containing protein [Vicinamibacteria bacterium]